MTTTRNMSPTPFPIGMKAVYVAEDGGLFHGTVYANTVGKSPDYPSHPSPGGVYYRCLVGADDSRLVIPLLVCDPEDCEAVAELVRFNGSSAFKKGAAQ